MCDPTSLLMAASTAVGAIGQMQAASAQAQAARMQATINRRNAEFADQRAQDALRRGQEEEQRVRREGAQQRSDQRVQMAAAGLDLGFGSPLDVLVDTTTGIEMDSLRVRRNAALEAEDFDRQSFNFRAQAGLDDSSARNARRGGRLAALGTAIGGASKVAKNRINIA